MLGERKIEQLNCHSAIILCGGKGSRLGAIGKICPKTLLKVNGRTILEHHILMFENFGIRNIYLTVGHLGCKIEEFVARSSFATKTNVVEADNMGTGGAIKRALSCLPQEDELFWVSMGDIFFFPDLRMIMKKLIEANAQGVILGTKVHNPQAYGVLICDDDGNLLNFKEKEVTKGPAVVDAGLYLFRKRIFSSNNYPDKFSIEYDLFPNIKNLAVYEYEGLWVDIGNIHSLRLARSFYQAI